MVPSYLSVQDHSKSAAVKTCMPPVSSPAAVLLTAEKREGSFVTFRLLSHCGGNSPLNIPELLAVNSSPNCSQVLR